MAFVNRVNAVILRDASQLAGRPRPLASLTFAALVAGGRPRRTNLADSSRTRRPL